MARQPEACQIGAAIHTSRERASSMACRASPFSGWLNSISGETMPVSFTLPPLMFCKVSQQVSADLLHGIVG